MAVKSVLEDSKRANVASALSELIIGAPDVFYAAAIMNLNDFYIG